MFANQRPSPRAARANSLALAVFAIAYVAVMAFLFLPRSWIAPEPAAIQRAAAAPLAIDQPLTR
ncbi:hypothetical protein [Frigidibacter sp. MR17.24]|uniref:hypothetical protein n=1 Tax=Frigidibacter sp. MR17.24 TaxID=3127345 RepID=UPI003012AD09